MTPYEFIAKHQIEADQETLEELKSHIWIPIESSFPGSRESWECSRCDQVVLNLDPAPGRPIGRTGKKCSWHLMQGALK